MPENITYQKNELLSTRAVFQPTTFDAENLTIEVVWSTGVGVRRYDSQNNTYFNEILDVSTASVDLTRLNSGAPLLNNHMDYSLESVIGVVERAWIDKNVGKALVRFSSRDDVASIVQDVKSGILRSISVGYQVKKYEIEKRDGEIPTYTAVEWLPMELSLVPVPADIGAQVRSENLTNQNKEAFMPASNEPHGQDVKPQAVDVDAVRSEAIKTERQRIEDIKLTVRNMKLSDELADKFIKDGTSIDLARKLIFEELVKADQQIVTNTRGGADIQIVSLGADKLRTAATDAILARNGLLKSEEKHEKLQGNPFVGKRAREIARDCLENAGENTRGLSDDEIVKRAFTSSTSDFGVILENTLNRTVLMNYNTVADTWRRFCKTGNVTDFRDWKRLKLGSIGTLDAVPEDGEFKNKSLSDAEAEAIKVTTYGNIVNISRQMIVNDDLGAFLTVAETLGKAAALTIEKAVYAMLLANPTMSDGFTLFHANHKNTSATGTALTVTSIDADRVAMAKQMNVGGNDFLDIKPSVLLLPVELGGTARVINRSEYDPDATNKLQRINQVAGLFSDIIDSPRLSGTTRYYFADPAIMPAFEVAFLNGNDTPYLEQQNGFDVDGVKYKVRLDFGVAAIESRAVYRNLGA
jgi:hypothetical protein